MTRTGLQVITDALKLIGVVAGHEVPTGAETQDSFARLAELIDSWGTHAHTMFAAQRTVVPLVVGQQTYTVGAGGDVDVDPPPMTVTAASYVVAGAVPTEVFLDLGTDQAAIGVAQKTLTGAVPQVLSYTRDTPLNALWVWPVPSAAVDVVLYWTAPVAQFPDLVTPVTLAPGYAKALRTNLAVELAPEFGRVVDPMVDRLARESLADIKRQNLPFVELGGDPGLPGACGGPYDIATDA